MVQFKCSQCKTILDQFKIKPHISGKHLSYYPFECRSCDEANQKYLATTYEDMSRHISTNHGRDNKGCVLVEKQLKEMTLKKMIGQCKRVPVLQIISTSSSDKCNTILRQYHIAAKPSASSDGNLLKPLFQIYAKPIPILSFDIVRDVFANFDRKLLYRLQFVNKRFNLIIKHEFNHSPPYFIFTELNLFFCTHEYTMTMKDHDYDSVFVNFAVIQKIVALKFIRFRRVNVYIHVDFHTTLKRLFALSHVWEDGHLDVECTSVKEFSWSSSAQEFFRPFESCRKLRVTADSSISFLDEMNFCNYKTLAFYDYDYDPLSQQVPWAKMTDFLFRATESSKRFFIYTIHPTNRKETMEFVNSVKEKFLSTTGSVNFDFQWKHRKFHDDSQDAFFTVERNNHRLICEVNSDGFSMKTYLTYILIKHTY